ncbi:MAG: hypothetical protein J6B96_00750 [Agathobacter sp.]|nr:hypothetical protein [Agathobacter sp.]
MSIRPVDISGIMQRSDDVGMLKHQQDSRPAVEQQNAQTQVAKRTEELRHQVMNPENSNKPDTHADAREKGKNEYFFRKGNGNKKKEETECRVVKKHSNGSFDVKV